MSPISYPEPFLSRTVPIQNRSYPEPFYRSTILSLHEITQADYERLLAFRTGLRRFLHWSEEQAHASGLTAAQHQLLLTIRGHRDRRGPTVGEVAETLLLRHHSAVGLVDRAQAAGLVRREPDASDNRVVRLRLTPDGRRRLARLSRHHLQELDRFRTQLVGLGGEGPG